MINYAHRGASSYAPENTMASFNLGLAMKANGIETDVRRTKDGVLVLFHDDTLMRITGEPGSIEDYTYQELLAMDFGAFKGPTYKGEKIVRFQDFLDRFGHLGLHLAIELKGNDVGLETVQILQDMHVENYTITSFLYDQLLEVRAAYKDIRIGYLTSDCTTETVDRIVADGLTEFCPEIVHLTPDVSAYAHAKGLSVRAWGVQNKDLMMYCFDCNVDGMTVNFPDVLEKYQREIAG